MYRIKRRNSRRQHIHILVLNNCTSRRANNHTFENYEITGDNYNSPIKFKCRFIIVCRFLSQGPDLIWNEYPLLISSAFGMFSFCYKWKGLSNVRLSCPFHHLSRTSSGLASYYASFCMSFLMFAGNSVTFFWSPTVTVLHQKLQHCFTWTRLQWII